MRPRLAHAALLTLLALSIVASFQAIGTLLVFGLLVGPPATASLLVQRVPIIMMTSIALGAAAVVAGLVVSFHHGTAGGATIAGFSVLQFFIVLIAREFVVALRHRGSPRSNQPDQAIASLAPGSLP
jgi:ABC-type Mn2+/Zn2+ transport system permease subunit